MQASPDYQTKTKKSEEYCYEKSITPIEEEYMDYKCDYTWRIVLDEFYIKGEQRRRNEILILWSSF